VDQANLTWSLARRDGGWLVRLRVVDSNLQLPYVLEPTTAAQRGIR
jgi:hypothetical protein